jgi:hypothetical protein
LFIYIIICLYIYPLNIPIIPKEYYEANRDKILEYHRENRDVINARNKIYYQNNKERLNKSIQCDVCGGTYSGCHKTRHEQTKKHNKAKNEKNNILIV